MALKLSDFGRDDSSTVALSTTKSTSLTSTNTKTTSTSISATSTNSGISITPEYHDRFTCNGNSRCQKIIIMQCA